ncbi:hypothetical protein ETAE_0412 [Edwardsiella piscicida]|uniref:Uncharacterized protein n=2 Tax=Edwardsiella TaxID=635 RepID=A0A0H3DPS0_EDWTF|nr:hypothetical protein ETAE_0412 [Edwardsiella tarda EIB202]ADM40491.1 hypothetical protein ETAF_0367 [Edwardsiella tarda FL6-60]
MRYIYKKLGSPAHFFFPMHFFSFTPSAFASIEKEARYQ